MTNTKDVLSRLATPTIAPVQYKRVKVHHVCIGSAAQRRSRRLYPRNRAARAVRLLKRMGTDAYVASPIVITVPK